MSTIHVQIITPDEMVYHGEVDHVVGRALDGEFAIYAGHAPIVAALEEGVIRLETGEGTLQYAVEGGFLEVANREVCITTDRAQLKTK